MKLQLLEASNWCVHFLIYTPTKKIHGVWQCYLKKNSPINNISLQLSSESTLFHSHFNHTFDGRLVARE